MEGRTLGRRVAVNTAAQVAGRVIILGLAAVSIAIITRYLGPTLYGRYVLALAYIGLSNDISRLTGGGFDTR